MQVKIDTSERFHVITIQERLLSANMTEELVNKLYFTLKEPIKNVVLNWLEVQSVEPATLAAIVRVQEDFYSQKSSFVNCCMQKSVKQVVISEALEDLLNTTPTESEAIDIIQMEEIERELADE